MGEDKIKADWVVTSRKLKAEEIADAKSFFMMYGPEDLSIVVREMQEMGWSKFVLRDIRGSERTKVRGLAEGLGWIAEWRARKRREIAKIAELGGKVRGLDVAAEKNARVAGKKSVAESDDECMGTAAIAATPQALKELKFEHWLPTTRPKWNWNWRYQKHIFKRLAPVTNGTARRLAIFLPPRHRKSELVTVRYAAWRLLQKPGLRIVIGSPIM